MNEHDLKSAMQDVLVASSPPPPMDPGAALDHARRAQRRRKATLGGSVAGLAVVAIAVGAVMVPNMTGSGDTVQVGGQSSAPSVTPPSITPTGMPSAPPSVTGTGRPPSVPVGGPASKTSTPWPNGQTDRTATSGPRADKSVAVLNNLASSLPTGVKAEDRTRIGFEGYGPMTRSQSQFADYAAGDLEVWEYMAYTPVVRSGAPGVGKLWIQVETKGNTRVENRPGCALAISRPYPLVGDGRCDVVDVGGKQVAVVTANGTANVAEGGMDQVAFFRYEDGTLVIVAQSKEYWSSGHPALGELPLTPQQLAAIAADPEFHLD